MLKTLLLTTFCLSSYLSYADEAVPASSSDLYQYLKTGKDSNTASETTVTMEGTVVSTMNAAGYTYIEMENKAKGKVWLAYREVAVKKGDKIAFPAGEPMHDFHSKTLNRTFPEIYFANALNVNGSSVEGHSKEYAANTAAPIPTPAAPAPETQKAAAKTSVSGTKVSLKQLFGNKTQYKDKVVIVTGKVTKKNDEILGKNWVHISDDTLSDKAKDLTVTTQAVVNIGDKVQAKGKITTDKDIGSGYFFDVIIEDAEVTKQ